MTHRYGVAYRFTRPGEAAELEGTLEVTAGNADAAEALAETAIRAELGGEDELIGWLVEVEDVDRGDGTVTMLDRSWVTA